MSAAGKGPKRWASGPGGGEGQANAAAHFDDAGGDLEEFEAQRGERRLGQVARGGNGVADGEHQPIGGGVENEADLVGERRGYREPPQCGTMAPGAGWLRAA
jgi:hypothetical protein